jgi:hypothetical protein
MISYSSDEDIGQIVMALKSTLIAALCVVTTTGYNTDDQVNPDIPFGTFGNPSAHVRPRFRSVIARWNVTTGVS